MIEIGEDLPEVKLEDRLRRVAINQCCSIVYTSGTDGATKGVMMSHDNVTWSSKMVTTHYSCMKGGKAKKCLAGY